MDTLPKLKHSFNSVLKQNTSSIAHITRESNPEIYVEPEDN